jgi:polysaccharide biosynthesis/export protein
VLRITVYEHPDLSQEVLVNPDGAFAYPLLERVQAAGLTVQALEQSMVQRLAAEYLVNPQLAVTVVQSRSQQVYVLGAVRNPGTYPLRYGATLLELISQAGGPTPEAGWLAMLVRDSSGPNGSRENPERGQANAAVVQVELDKLLAGEVLKPIGIASGDTIYVPTAGYVFVSGQVERPGQYRLERGTTVQRAITLAGGFTKFAATSRLRVKRSIAGKPQEFQAQLDDRLQAEDILIVPESVF